MRRMKRIIAALLIAGLPGMGIPQGRTTGTLDLSQAIKMAITQNRLLARSALGTSINALGVVKAETAFQIDVRPELYLDTEGSLTVTGGGLSASKKMPWGTRLSVQGFLAGTSGDGSSMLQKTLQVEISQPLFRNFGTLIQEEPLVQARHDYRTSLRALEIQKDAIALRVVESYENILQLARQVLVEQASAGRMEKLVRLARAKEVLGRTKRVDTLRTELLRGQAQFRLEAIQESLSFAQRDFAELLGADPDTIFDLKPTLLLELNVPSLEESLRTALRNRLDYAQALQDGADTARGVRIAGRNLIPGLDLVVRKNWTAGNSLIASSTPFNQWSVGLSLDMNLNLKEERAALEQARLADSSATLGTGITELSIAREVNQQRAAYRRAQAELKIADRNKDLAASRRKLAQQLFELGRSDQFSVTDAEETFLLAENQWLSARAEASLAGYRFLHVLGTLVETPRNLKPGSVSEDP